MLNAVENGFWERERARQEVWTFGVASGVVVNSFGEVFTRFLQENVRDETLVNRGTRGRAAALK